MVGVVKGSLFGSHVSVRPVVTRTDGPKSGLPSHLWPRHWARPHEPCAACGECKPDTVSHHDHFRDLVDEIARDKGILLDRDPATFQNVTLCNACNHLCVKFKVARKNAAAFMSLSPEDMRLFLDGMSTVDLLERVEDRYREPFRMWATQLDAWPEFIAAYKSGRDIRKPRQIVKPERRKVLDTLDERPDLRAAFDQRDLRLCHRLGRELEAQGQWGREEFHSFSALLWFEEHGGPSNYGAFSDAFECFNDLPAAIRIFKRGVS